MYHDSLASALIDPRTEPAVATGTDPFACLGWELIPGSSGDVAWANFAAPHYHHPMTTGVASLLHQAVSTPRPDLETNSLAALQPSYAGVSGSLESSWSLDLPPCIAAVG